MKYKVGDKIYFKEEKRPYTVMACDDQYLVCTKPFNLKKGVVQYTIVDLKEEIRGADNYWKWGGFNDYRTKEECEEVLTELHNCDLDGKHVMISPSNRIELNIIKVKSA